MIQIKHRRTEAVLFESEAETLRKAVEEAVKQKAYLGGADLGGADLGDADLGGADLGDADLSGADLSGADLGDAYLRDAYLRDADLGGADLGGADVGGAYLGGAYLGGADLRGAYLRGAYLRDAYLGGADVGGAYLGGADLRGAKGLPEPLPPDPETPYVRVVAKTDAERAERFRKHHPEVPVIADLDRRILAAIEAGGALDMSSWHSCATTHCRAGWAITLAGEKGAELEKKHGPQRAGMLIYGCSTGRVPHFFASNDVAMEDIRACAAKSAEPPIDSQAASEP